MGTFIAPTFEENSHSQHVASLFDPHQEWHNSPPITKRMGNKTLERTVTWAHYPNRYWAEQFVEQKEHTFGSPQLIHRMFTVSLLSVMRTVDGKRNFEQWHIVKTRQPSETILHIQRIVDEPEAERQTGEMKRALDFMLDNGFYVPNNEDLWKLESIVSQGRSDGVDPFAPDQIPGQLLSWYSITVMGDMQKIF